MSEETQNTPAVPTDCVEGTVERIVYENAENGFFVARLSTRSPENSEVTFVGNLMAVSAGETVRLWGRWVEDARWGRQLRVERYETLTPSTVEAIEKYLGSGLIEGIGPVLAKRLVKAFGIETLRVIDEFPKRLGQVPGIGKKRQGQIREAWQKQRAVQSIMLFLQGHGISTARAVRIYKQYGDSAVAILRENPYRLADDIFGIGFRGADKIAMSIGISHDAPRRLEAGLRYALDRACGEGHVFMPTPDLLQTAGELLDAPTDALENALVELAARRTIVREDDAVYLLMMYEAERNSADLVRRLLLTPGDGIQIDGARAVKWIEKTQQIALSEGQQQAILGIAESKVLVVTGGPGTGKTTVIRSLVAIFEKKGLRVELSAPTGRASKRMESATGHPARTLHRMLEFSPKQGTFLRNADNPLDTDVVIVDESSMLDIRLFHDLIAAVPRKARLIFVGDVDQLPSVGAGCVLFDLIASTVCPVVWLKTVFRQAEQSGIVRNAHEINQGNMPRFNPDDFFFIDRDVPEKAVEAVVELVKNRLPAKFGLDPLKDVQVLAPMHRGEAGIAKLNEALQNALNPESKLIERSLFRLGDKVMQVRNNYELEVFNGDIGVVKVVDAETREIEVEFDDRRVIYKYDDLDNLTLAYAVTIHKSQGSEYPAVVLLLMPQHYMLLQRNVLYTAVTRGKRIVVIVGAERALGMAIKNNTISRRHSRLVDRLRDAMGKKAPHTPKLV